MPAGSISPGGGVTKPVEDSEVLVQQEGHERTQGGVMGHALCLVPLAATATHYRFLPPKCR